MGSASGSLRLTSSQEELIPYDTIFIQSAEVDCRRESERGAAESSEPSEGRAHNSNTVLAAGPSALSHTRGYSCFDG
eukprot:5680129-Pleurochrysis_carterae.AAC.5